MIGSFGRIVNRIGGPGAGQQAKMVNQICIAGLVQGLSEAINFGIKAGLDMDVVLDTIGGGAAQSWQMVNRGKTMVADEFDFGFAVDWMIKDLGIAWRRPPAPTPPCPSPNRCWAITVKSPLMEAAAGTHQA